MQRFGWIIGRVLLVILALAAAFWLWAPREPVDREIEFDAASLPVDLDAYLISVEAGYPDIPKGAEKRILWAGARGAQTDLSVVYLHGYSASAPEISPVPEKVAEALQANLFFTRLTGHGLDGNALAAARAGDWLEDAAEALAIGRRLGKQVVVIATSTGGTLAAIAATDPGLSEQIAGIIFVSPNFGVGSPGADLLTWPFSRLWVPLIVGPDRSFEPVNAAHGTYWTLRYPTRALIPMAALVKYAVLLDYSKGDIPALFYFSTEDRVVAPEVTQRIAGRWGGDVTIVNPVANPGDDPLRHVMTGDIRSPSQTDKTIQTMLDWIKGV